MDLCSLLLWFQVESKKAATKNLESSVEEFKGRLATQLDEQSRLEDKMRGLSIELTTQQAQVEKLHHDVSGLADQADCAGLLVLCRCQWFKC